MANKTEQYGIHAKNRENLISYINERLDMPPEDYDHYAYVKLDCECEKTYPTPDDIPSTSDKCEHNNYFIKYD